MKCERVQELLLDAVDGALDPALDSAVRGHLEACASCRREAGEAGEMWALLGRLEAVPAGEDARARFEALVDGEAAAAGPRPAGAGGGSPSRISRLWPSRPSLQALLAAAALVLGVGIGMALQGGSQGREADQLRDEMREMLGAATLSLLSHPSASERLRAVSLFRASGPDDRLVEGLLHTVRDDPSVNVRLAALHVLAGLTRRADVRSGLVDSFPGQESPVMQVALAEVLLAMDGEGSRREIRKLLAGEELPEAVRSYLLELLTEGKLET